MTVDWTAIVEQHGRAVYQTAWRVLGHAADTEDVVQEVFMEAYRIDGTQVVRHWGGLLRRLATCRALDRLRQRKSTVSLQEVLLANVSDSPEEAAFERELRERLRQAVAQLPEREATVFCLWHFEGLAYQEIADLLQIRSGAVGVALHKARARLQTLLTAAIKGE